MAKRKIKKFIRAAIAPLLIPLTRILRRRNKNNVCIFHNGRCGSTVVGNLLGKHNKIHWDGQIYAKLFVKPDGKTFGKIEYKKGFAMEILKDRAERRGVKEVETLIRKGNIVKQLRKAAIETQAKVLVIGHPIRSPGSNIFKDDELSAFARELAEVGDVEVLVVGGKEIS